MAAMNADHGSMVTAGAGGRTYRGLSGDEAASRLAAKGLNEFAVIETAQLMDDRARSAARADVHASFTLTLRNVAKMP